MRKTDSYISNMNCGVWCKLFQYIYTFNTTPVYCTDVSPHEQVIFLIMRKTDSYISNMNCGVWCKLFQYIYTFNTTPVYCTDVSPHEQVIRFIMRKTDSWINTPESKGDDLEIGPPYPRTRLSSMSQMCSSRDWTCISSEFAWPPFCSFIWLAMV